MEWTKIEDGLPSKDKIGYFLVSRYYPVLGQFIELVWFQTMGDDGPGFYHYTSDGEYETNVTPTVTHYMECPKLPLLDAKYNQPDYQKLVSEFLGR